MQREAAFCAEKESLLATIQHEVDAAARERAAHTTALSNRDAAAAAERALLHQQLREAEESFAVQREALNGHIAGGPSTLCLYCSIAGDFSTPFTERFGVHSTTLCPLTPYLFNPLLSSSLCSTEDRWRG
jgi:hypothetical protein